MPLSDLCRESFRIRRIVSASSGERHQIFIESFTDQFIEIIGAVILTGLNQRGFDVPDPAMVGQIAAVLDERLGKMASILQLRIDGRTFQVMHILDTQLPTGRGKRDVAAFWLAVRQAPSIAKADLRFCVSE